MKFTNYSQTYAANITAFFGMTSALLALFGMDFIGEQQFQFVLGTILNFGGIVWSLVQRYRKGDLSFFGLRRN